jgi:hypothetical protein
MWPNEMTAKGPKSCLLTWTDDRNSEEAEALFQDVIIEQLVGIEDNLVLARVGTKGSGCKLKIGACCICMGIIAVFGRVRTAQGTAGRQFADKPLSCFLCR